MLGVAEIEAEGPLGAREVDRAIVYFKSQITLFVGMAEGREGVSLGDVAVATRIYGFASDEVGREQPFRPVEYRPNYTLLDRVREEVEGLAWLGHIPDGMPAQVPSVVLGQVAAGENVLSTMAHSSFPLLPRQQGETVSFSSEDIGFYRPAFENNAKALLVQGIVSLRGASQDVLSEELQAKAVCHASAFAFHILSQIVPVPVHELRSAASGLGARSTWMAVMMSILFGVIVSLPLFCVRQNPFVKDVGVGEWTVWLGAQHHSHKDHHYWVATFGKKSTPVALLYLDPSTFDGFGPATPLYWNPAIGSDAHRSWELRPWKKVEPPRALRHHPWLLLIRRADGSLTFPHLYPNVPKRGRGLVYSSFKRTKPVGEVAFVLGSQLTIHRVFWNWKILSEEQGPWVLRLLSSSQATPRSLRKHRWPPLLTLQQERFQDSNRWRFLDKVAGLQWPGSQWLVLRPGTAQTTQEPFGLVELEPGEGRWVKVLRLPWKNIRDFRHITVRYFDPNKDKMPNLSRFGEISQTCPKRASFPGFGACVETNLGSASGALPFTWYAVQGGSLSPNSRKNDKAKGYVQLLRVNSTTSLGQAFLWTGTKKRWRQLVRLTPKEQQQSAALVCRKALSRLHKLQRLAQLHVRTAFLHKEASILRAQFRMIRLLGGQVSSKGWLPPPSSSVVGRCLRYGETLLRKLAKKLQTPTWSQRWRKALALSSKAPQKAYPLLQELCDTAETPASQQRCHRTLLRVELGLRRPVSSSWEKRLRLMIHREPCLTIPVSKDPIYAVWKTLEEQLRILDKKPYRKKFCKLLRYEFHPVTLLILQIQPDPSLAKNGSAYVMGVQLTNALQREFSLHWNAKGLRGAPHVLTMKEPSVPHKLSLPKLKIWLREIAQHSGASMVLTGSFKRLQGRFVLRLSVYANTLHNVFHQTQKEKPLALWQKDIILGTWSQFTRTSQQIAKLVWPFLQQAQRRPLPLPIALPEKMSKLSKKHQTVKEMTGPPMPATWRAGARPKPRPGARPNSRPGARPNLRPVSRPNSRPATRPNLRPVARPNLRPVSRPSFRNSKP